MTKFNSGDSSSSNSRPDTESVLSGLKDFQRATVNHVFRRLYEDADCTRRYLVADEVGLGKTMVARGVIAKTIDHLWDRTGRIDIVYVCSNADIARQNITRLKLKGCHSFSLASRITLLPITINQPLKPDNKRQQGKKNKPSHMSSNGSFEGQKVNFVSFTPGTSFDVGHSGGIAKERALLYWMLKDDWRLDSRTSSRPFEGNASRKGFQWALDFVNPASGQCKIHAEIKAQFAERVCRDKLIRYKYDELLKGVPPRKKLPVELRSQCLLWIGRLRQILAESCLDWLEPDLIILDEFQRFKDLMDGQREDASPAAKLAELLFNFQSNKHDEATAARVLLLSATPYKMLTVKAESDTDDHYADFRLTLNFLISDSQKQQEFCDLLQQYREELFHVADRGTENLKRIKTNLENLLRSVMVRTERLAVDPERNGMLEVKQMPVILKTADVHQYLGLQKIARFLKHGDMLEYWKSAPYLLNFMDEYKFKTELKSAIESQTDGLLSRAVQSLGDGLLDRETIEKYGQIDPGNARLRALAQDTIGREAWQLLWIPPSLPYYQGSDAFSSEQRAGFTKRLVFSNWKVVPKAIASFLSYEAERQMTRQFRKPATNTPEARKKRGGLLQFNVKSGEPLGMSALGLLYPSRTLATCVDPLTLLSEPDATLKTALAKAEIEITKRLQPVIESHRTNSLASSDRWYWAAPILMDLHHHRKATRRWLSQENLAENWKDAAASDDETATNWSKHVSFAQELLEGNVELGEPPADLARILAMKALAAPGVVAYRALLRVIGFAFEKGKSYDLRNDAGRLAHAFRSLFNSIEVMDLLRGNTEEDAYWKSVLEYSLGGNIQAMLDEYVHVLVESLSLKDKKPEKFYQQLVGEIGPAMSLRTSTSQADIFSTTPQRVKCESVRLRNHFAMRFGDQSHDNDNDKERTSSGNVQKAFNSPFWPFVLASTSVGQEGLDFHPYCHAVVHWNLPSNPVDLEQREGRVHRYKGHAVRKNIAQEFANAARDCVSGDPWEAMFRQAVLNRDPSHNDLYPFWISTDGANGSGVQRCLAKIERHVPAIPHSREITQQVNLQKALVLYRMVFGQNRQEDLIAYLQSRFSESQVRELIETCRIDLSPPP